MADLKATEKNSLRNNYYYNIKKTLTMVSTALLAFVIISATVSPSTVLAESAHFIGTPTINKVISGASSAAVR